MESIIKEMLIIEINNILKEFSLSINKYLKKKKVKDDEIGDQLSPKGVFPYSSPGICLYQQNC